MGLEMSKKLKNANVYAKHFSGCQGAFYPIPPKTLCKRTTKLHCTSRGCHRSRLDWTPDLIAKAIVDVACSLKNENYDQWCYSIYISSRADYFKVKSSELNEHLSKFFWKEIFI